MATNPSRLDDDDFLNPSNWLSCKELAAILGVSQQGFYNMMAMKANLPPQHRRVGSQRVMFFKPQVRAWMTDPNCFKSDVPLAQKACA